MQNIQFINWGDPEAPKKAKVHTGKHIRRERKLAKQRRAALTPLRRPLLRPQEAPVTDLDRANLATSGEAPSSGPSRHAAPAGFGSSCAEGSAARRWSSATDTGLAALEHVRDLDNEDDDDVDEYIQSHHANDITNTSSALSVYENRLSSPPTAYLPMLGKFFDLVSQINYSDQCALQWFLIDRPEKTLNVTAMSPIKVTRDYFFPCVAGGPLAFHGALYYGLVHRSFSSSESLQVDKPRSLDTWPARLHADSSRPFAAGTYSPEAAHMLEERGRLVSWVTKRIEDPAKAVDDDLIFGIAAMVLAESRLGDVFGWQVHYEGLMRIIELKGGYESLSGNIPLSASLAWLEISLVRPANSLQLDDGTSSAGVFTLFQSPTIQAENHAFIDFLLDMQRLPSSRAILARNPALSPIMRLIQRKEPLLRSMLDEIPEEQLPGQVRNTGFVRTRSVMSQIDRSCHLFALLYINYVLYTVHSSAKGTAAFLSKLMKQVSKPLGTGSRLLIFVLIQEMIEDDINRLWWHVRAMRVVHRLRLETCEILHGLLLDGLLDWTLEKTQNQDCEFSELLELVQVDLQEGQRWWQLPSTPDILTARRRSEPAPSFTETQATRTIP